MAKQFDINSSLHVSGDIRSTDNVEAVNISASEFHGDGSNITNFGGGNILADVVSSAGISAVKFNGDGSEITNLGGGNVLNDLSVAGNVGAVNISASEFHGDGSNITNFGGGNILADVVSSAGISAVKFNGDGSEITNWGGGTVGSDVTVSGNISATALYGDGTNITNFGGGTIANDVTVSGNISADAFYGDGSNITNLAGGTVIGDLVVEGDFTVRGTETALNTNNLNVDDNIITLNAGLTGNIAPTLDAGIEVKRGNENTAQLIFDETTNAWQAGISGDIATITRSYSSEAGQFAVYVNDTGDISGSPNLTFVDNMLSVQGAISGSVFLGDGSKLVGITDRLFGVNEENIYFERIKDGSLNTSTTPFNNGLPKHTFPVSVSSVESGWDIYAPFDGDTSVWNNAWYSEENNPMPQWISVKLLMCVNKYRFFTFSSNYGPTDWELQGRYKGSAWETLDSRSGETTINGWTPYYTFNNDTDYDEHRLYVTAVDPASPFGAVRIHEIELIDSKKVLDAKLGALTHNVVPTSGSTLSLGTSASPFKDLYVEEDSIYMGPHKLSIIDGDLNLDGSLVGIYPDNISLAVTEISGTEYLEIKDVVEKDITITGTLNVSGGIEGDIIPAISGEYSLGSADKPWKDLYVTNNSLYVGGVALRVDEFGNLTTGGDPNVGINIEPNYELQVHGQGTDSRIQLTTDSSGTGINDGGLIYQSTTGNLHIINQENADTVLDNPYGGSVSINSSLKLSSGTSVNQISTTISNDDNILPTAGAVFDHVQNYDYAQYTLTDGSRAFTGTVSGVTPTLSLHLATKGYVDSNFLEEANNLSDLTNINNARTNLGLGNVDNTSDANKPVSTAQQNALNTKPTGTLVITIGNPGSDSNIPSEQSVREAITASLFTGGTVTTALLGPNNTTATAPTYSFNGDADNGMFRPTTNTLAFSTAGNERLRLGATGNLAVGTQTPTYNWHFHEPTASTTSYLHITSAETGGLQTDGLLIGYNSLGSICQIYNRENVPLAFYTNDTERMRITSGGNLELTNSLKIGTGATVSTIETTLTNDDTKLPTSGAVVDYVATNAPVFNGGTVTTPIKIQESSAGVAPHLYGDGLVIEANGTTGLSILTNSGSSGYIMFGSSVSATRGFIQYNHGTDELQFHTASTQRLSLNSSGLKIGTGATVDSIETTITDSDTKLPSSGAVVDYAEPVFSKNNAFNKNFGSTVGTVCQGNDGRLSDSRTCNNSFDNAGTARTNLGLGTVSTLNSTATVVDGQTTVIPTSDAVANYVIDYVSNNSPVFNGGTISNAILSANGSLSAPAYSFSADTNTGIYRSSEDTLRLVTGGAPQLSIFSTKVVVTNVLEIDYGSVTSPGLAFDADEDTGIYGSSGTLNIATAGTRKATFDSGGLTLASGTDVNEFSTDDLLDGDSPNVVPTESAVRGFVERYHPEQETNIGHFGIRGNMTATVNVNDLVFAEGWFVATTNNGIKISRDGFSWQDTNITTGNWSSITHGLGRFVAVRSSTTDNIAWVSTASSTWTQFTGPSQTLVRVTYADGVGFTAVSDGAQDVFISSVGSTTWSGYTLTGDPILSDVAYGGGTVIVVGLLGSLGCIYKSTSGTIWSLEYTKGSEIYQCCTYGQGKFVALGWNSVATSTDGITWTDHGVHISGWRPFSVTYDNGMFVAVGDGATTQCAISYDGITWTHRDMLDNVDLDWYGIAYGRGTWVAGCDATSENIAITPAWGRDIR